MVKKLQSIRILKVHSLLAYFLKQDYRAQVFFLNKFIAFNFDILYVIYEINKTIIAIPITISSNM